MRLYVPVDLYSAGTRRGCTAGHLLPEPVWFVVDADPGSRVTRHPQTDGQLPGPERRVAGGTDEALCGFRRQFPTPWKTHPRQPSFPHGEGPYAQSRQRLPSMCPTPRTRGDLVVIGPGPTYQSGFIPQGQRLGSTGIAESPGPLLVVVHRAQRSPYRRLPPRRGGSYPSGSTTFIVIVAPTCPGAGYANCIEAGPEPLQNSLSYRNLLPNQSFAPLAFTVPMD